MLSRHTNTLVWFTKQSSIIHTTFLLSKHMRLSDIKHNREEFISIYFPIRNLTQFSFLFLQKCQACGFHFLRPRECIDNSDLWRKVSDHRDWSMGLCASMSTCRIPGTSSLIYFSNRSTLLPKAVTASSPAKMNVIRYSF